MNLSYWDIQSQSPSPKQIIKITSEVPGFVILFTLFLSSILKKINDSTGVKACRRDQYSGMSMCLDGIHSRGKHETIWSQID